MQEPLLGGARSGPGACGCAPRYEELTRRSGPFRCDRRGGRPKRTRRCLVRHRFDGRPLARAVQWGAIARTVLWARKHFAASARSSGSSWTRLRSIPLPTRHCSGQEFRPPNALDSRRGGSPGRVATFRQKRYSDSPAASRAASRSAVIAMRLILSSSTVTTA
jgi:hypothetical protein